MTSRAVLARSHARDGFTLIETLVVLFVIALCVAIAAPLVRRPSDSLRLNELARTLIDGLGWTRAYAIAHNQDADFLIDVNTRGFASPAVKAQTLPSDVAMKLVFSDSLRRQSAVGGFRFYPSGASSGGEIIVKLGARTAHISVNWLTGSTQVSNL
jgi:general secretion pathway protein H